MILGLILSPLALFVLLVLLWAVPSYLIARYAGRKGHSFGGFLLLGLVISPIVSGIVALLVADRSQQPADDPLATGPDS